MVERGFLSSKVGPVVEQGLQVDGVIAVTSAPVSTLKSTILPLIEMGRHRHALG